MAAAGSVVLWYPRFKFTIYALLICNAVFYLFTGTWIEVLDTVAWLALLALFELETAFAGCTRTVGAAHAIRGARLFAATAISAALVGYIHQNEWLDAANIGLWIAVIVLLEIEVRFPRAVARRRKWFAVGAAVLYAGLALLVMVWAWREEWFDAYDALLWLIAFGMIEMDVLRLSSREATA